MVLIFYGCPLSRFIEETCILKRILGSTSEILASFESSSGVDSKDRNKLIQPKITYAVELMELGAG